MANAGDAFAAAEAYAERCKRLAMPVEPSIAVWLRLGGGSLQATEDLERNGNSADLVN